MDTTAALLSVHGIAFKGVSLDLVRMMYRKSKIVEELVDGVACVVNDEVISLYELNQAMRTAIDVGLGGATAEMLGLYRELAADDHEAIGAVLAQAAFSAAVQAAAAWVALAASLHSVLAAATLATSGLMIARS